MQLSEPRPRPRTISLTPLIDVVFILLLFFMLSTQFNQQKAMTLSIPYESSQALSEREERLSLHLSDTGDVIIAENESVSLKSLPSHMAVQEAIARDLPIQLNADDDTPLQLLVSVTDVLKRAGASTIQMTALR